MAQIDEVKKLREETGISVSDCKKALEKSGGDFEGAKEILKEWGKETVKSKTARQTSQGIIDTYLHPNKKVGVILELNCETDFVGKSHDFQTLAHELCLQIAAMGEEIPLLEQPWIKDQNKKIKELIEEHIAKLGENITIKRFTRYQL